MGRHLFGMFVQPALACGSFTVLFDMPVLRHDVLWRQGNDLRVSRAHKHRGDGRMIIEGVAIAELTGETVWTMNGLGRKVSGAIEGYQQLIAKNAQRRQHTTLFKALKDLNKHRIEVGDLEMNMVKDQIRTAYDGIMNLQFKQGCNDKYCDWCNFVKSRYQSVPEGEVAE